MIENASEKSHPNHANIIIIIIIPVLVINNWDYGLGGSELTVKILRPVRSNAIQYTAERWPRIRRCRRMRS